MAAFPLPDARVTAMARPMPREPPVTSAALPVKSNMKRSLRPEDRERLLERRGIFDVDDLDALVDALHEARQHLAGADLDHARHAESHHLLDALDPPHRGGHLLEQERHDARDLAVRLRLHVRHHRHPRLLPRDPAQHRLEAHLDRLHQRAVEGCGDGERQDPLRARGLELAARLLDRARRPRDDRLPGVVVVRRRADGARRRLDRLADRLHAGGLEAEHRRHRALSGRHRLLHERPARSHRPRGVRGAERARGDERGVLAERVARDEVGLDAVLRERRHHRRRDGQDGGLRVGGELELLVRPLEAQLRQLLSQRGVDGVEHRARRGRRLGERLAHSGGLRALPREDERELAHRLSYQRMTPAPQAMPAPIAMMRIVSPGLNQPARLASSSVVGTLAAEVLPYFSRFIQHFEAGISRRSSTASRNRLFAWCAMTWVTSPGARWFAASASRLESSSARTANLYTSRPFMKRYCLRFSSSSVVSGLRDPGPGWCRMPHCEPSVWRWIDCTPRLASSVGCSTSAPAPSPKRMQVLRSFQSTMRVSVSAPTTRAFFATPLEM